VVSTTFNSFAITDSNSRAMLDEVSTGLTAEVQLVLRVAIPFARAALKQSSSLVTER
jgi:hypothetical protein